MTKRTETVRVSEDFVEMLNQLQKDLEKQTGLDVSKIDASSFLARNFKLKIPKNI